MNRDKVFELAKKLITICDGYDKEDVMFALNTAVAGSIYHCYNEEDRWEALEQFRIKLPVSLKGIISGYEHRQAH